MKRKDLVKHLRRHGCEFVREGASHSIWKNRKNSAQSAVPRHHEIVSITALKICDQLGIPRPKSVG
jgi:predicted RNA binding protein YcfA (HicA-like mRNA interferase family)